MRFNAEKLGALVRLLVAVAFFCTSLTYSMPNAEASFLADGKAVASVECDHSDIGERSHPISKIASNSKADVEECVPNGKPHSEHGDKSSEYCAEVSFDITILVSGRAGEARLPSQLSSILAQLVRAVEPYRFLRPPRA